MLLAKASAFNSSSCAKIAIAASSSATSVGFTQIDCTGVLTARGSPLRSVINPRLATRGTVRIVRASP